MSRPQHRTRPGATYFVTTDTWQRRELFRKRPMAEIVEAKIFEYRNEGRYMVHRYVLMPEHLHLILTPGLTTTLEKAMALIKGGSSFDIGKAIATRFPVWHAGFTEHQIRDGNDFDTHVRYIDSNPVKAGLVTMAGDYPYCSLNGRHEHDPWPVASGAKAPTEDG